MAENSKIEWTDHTMNFWLGCQKVSLACDFCYAESWAKRAGRGHLWGGKRERTRDWKGPFKWNEAAKAAGVRAKVFTNSLADFFDNQADPQWRIGAWKWMAMTPWLDWLILTKRPQNIAKMLPADWGARGYANVWLGTTVENNEECARRVPHLLGVPAVIHFLSVEPMLGPVHPVAAVPNQCVMNAGEGKPQIDWIICGGESGPSARRPMDLSWARDLAALCLLSNTAFFMKQIDKKQPIPADLMVRQFPRVAP